MSYLVFLHQQSACDEQEQHNYHNPKKDNY